MLLGSERQQGVREKEEKELEGEQVRKGKAAKVEDMG